MTDIYEDMIRVVGPRSICRVWREHGLGGISNDQLRTLVRSVLDEDITVLEACQAISSYSRVNSVEIVDADGQGVCLHRNWP